MRTDGIVEDFSLNKCLTSLFPAWAQSRAAKVSLLHLAAHALLPAVVSMQQLGPW